ncbi:MAG TPA: hypothetical protein VGB65_05790 [Allosphingosinicella sp.]|jgi:hypothetical protein
MVSNFAEWIVRTVMLVLAGLVTLSILGSIDAMSNDTAGAGFRGANRPVLSPAPEPSAPAQQPAPAAPAPRTDASQAQQEGTGAPGQLVTAPASPEEPRPERWLKAIAYALLAIAGLLALLLILVWRGVRALSRIAEAAALGQQRN